MVHASRSYEDAVDAKLVKFNEKVLGANLSRCIVGFNEGGDTRPDTVTKSTHTTDQYVRVFKRMKDDERVYEGFKVLLRVLSKRKLSLSTYWCVRIYKCLGQTFAYCCFLYYRAHSCR